MSGKVYRALVMSDSHGSANNLRWLLEEAWKRVGPIDIYIHCGDGNRDFEELDQFIRSRDRLAGLIGVRGNCDFCCDEMEMRCFHLGTCAVMVTHGHRYHVKDELGLLAWAAKEHGCSVALFGHTHHPTVEDRDGVLLLNPGTSNGDTLGLLTVDEDGKAKA